MALKTFKPYTKSTRGTVVLDKSNLWKGAPYKPLTKVKILLGEEIITAHYFKTYRRGLQTQI